MNLESELRGLTIDWPETPPLRLELGRRRRRWPIAVALAAAALAAAFAVPQSRGAILRALHLGGALDQRRAPRGRLPAPLTPPCRERPSLGARPHHLPPRGPQPREGRRNRVCPIPPKGVNRTTRFPEG